jgi:integrase
MHRYSKGGVCQQRGRWKGLWYENGLKKSKILGLCKEMSKGEAREAVAKIIRNFSRDETTFGGFVEGPYFDFYGRKWKPSTAENNKQRIRTHLVAAFGERELLAIKRDDLQAFLDEKGPELSFSVVDHLRWDARQIFAMAIAEGLVQRNPAQLLFTPKEAKKPVRRVMKLEEVQLCFDALPKRERLIAKLAILGGMRPGEIFGLTWGQMAGTYAEVSQRVYRCLVDTPKTNQSYRKVALSAKLLKDIDRWKAMSIDSTDRGWVFPSENLTPLSKDNVWRRNMLPFLQAVGLDWCNFQVMRRTHATLMRQLKADPHQVAAQLGHSVDVSLNVYAQSPVECRVVLVNQLESLLIQ